MKTLAGRRCLLTFCSIALLLSSAFAQEKLNVAVLDLEGKNVSKSDASILTDKLRGELLRTGKIRVLERGQMEAILKEQGFQQTGCTDQSCIVEMGQLAGVERMVAGSVGKIGNMFLVSVRMIDVGKGEIVQIVDEEVEGQITDVLKRGIPNVAAKLTGTQPSTSPVTRTKKRPAGLLSTIANNLTGGADRSSGAATVHTTSGQEGEAADLSGMVPIKGGCFEMGSKKGDKNERPVHEVCVNDFEMDKTEITQENFQKVMGTNPSKFDGCADCPSDRVSWNEARAFCEKVGKRLPTEAEWEYAARAGASSKYYWGNAFSRDYAWYTQNSNGRTQPVGRKKPNAYGLYDMIGNVYEWCSDWYLHDYYKQNVRENPVGSSAGKAKVLRGGAWNYFGSYRTVSHRHKEDPGERKDHIGFRCVK